MAVWELSIGWVVAIASWALLIGEHAALPFVAISAVGTLFALWQSVEMVRNDGVRESSEGIANRRMFGYRRWRWEEIERFTHVQSGVYLVAQDGTATRLAGVNEGWCNAWDSGSTREITALLNDRLAAWRSAHLSGTDPPAE